MAAFLITLSHGTSIHSSRTQSFLSRTAPSLAVIFGSKEREKQTWRVQADDRVHGKRQSKVEKRKDEATVRLAPKACFATHSHDPNASVPKKKHHFHKILLHACTKQLVHFLLKRSDGFGRDDFEMSIEAIMVMRRR